MDKFTTHTGTGVPLKRSNVDTDQIIPKQVKKMHSTLEESTAEESSPHT